MRLSIIIPIYKVEKYLQRCLNSVVDQVPDDSELILVDDGSPDRCGAICDEYAEKYSFIHVIHQENTGLSCARNAGLQYVIEEKEHVLDSDYIVFIDSDDYIEENSIKKITECLEENPCEVLITRAKVVSDTGAIKDKMNYSIEKGFYTGKKYYNLIQRKNRGMATSCVMFNVYSLAFLVKNSMKFYPGIIHEDELWTSQIFLLAGVVYFSDIIFYNHYIRTGSLMHSDNFQKSSDSTITICNELIKYVKNFKYREVSTFYDRIVFLYLRGYIRADDEHFNSYRFLKRSFLIKYSFFIRQRVKAIGYCVSPTLYYKCAVKN